MIKLLIGLLSLTSITTAFAQTYVECKWDNAVRDGEIQLLHFEILKDKKFEQYSMEMSSDPTPDVINPHNNRFSVLYANTGDEVLESFTLNEYYTKYNNSMHFNKDGILKFGYYNLDYGIMTLEVGPVTLKADFPKAIPFDKAGAFGKIYATFPGNKKYTATCGLPVR